MTSRLPGVLRLSLPCHACCEQIRYNSNSQSITRINRRVKSYVRMYPTLLVKPDGSTITIRYAEPRRIIQFPEDLSLLSEEERQLRLLKRKPKQKIIVQEDIEDDFDINSYSHLWKNKDKQ